MEDLFNKDCSRLLKKKLWLFDMDGTIYNEDNLFDGTLQLLNKIIDLGGKYIFITNNSSKSVNDYIEKIKRMNIKCNYTNFYTSTQATINLLKSKHHNAKIYAQGTKSFIKELKNSGLNIYEDVSNVDIVLVGFDTELTSEKLKKTCEILNQDVMFYATNPDLACPVSFGFIPDCGSICEMIYNATGKRPTFIGKPNSTMVDFIRNENKYTNDETIIVGDRLYTDILTGINSNIDSICVLTGESKFDDIVNSQIKPTFVLNSVLDIYNCLNIK